MSAFVEREIKAYEAIQTRVSGKVIRESGLALFCAPGVMPPTNRVTRCFASVVGSLEASSVLDLGCGSGILALIASRYARQVIGVDVDPQAVACARYNATLNGVENVRFLLGDAYVPLGERRFDLIVSNPPFYPARGVARPPASMCVDGDGALLYSLIKGARQHLSPQGRVLFVTSSLSDNDRVKALLQDCALDFHCRLLHSGGETSQDIYLWRVERSR